MPYIKWAARVWLAMLTRAWARQKMLLACTLVPPMAATTPTGGVGCAESTM
jgi:hypothetical protein